MQLGSESKSYLILFVASVFASPPDHTVVIVIMIWPL